MLSATFPEDSKNRHTFHLTVWASTGQLSHWWLLFWAKIDQNAIILCWSQGQKVNTPNDTLGKEHFRTASSCITLFGFVHLRMTWQILFKIRQLIAPVSTSYMQGKHVSCDTTIDSYYITTYWSWLTCWNSFQEIYSLLLDTRCGYTGHSRPLVLSVCTRWQLLVNQDWTTCLKPYLGKWWAFKINCGIPYTQVSMKAIVWFLSLSSLKV